MGWWISRFIEAMWSFILRIGLAAASARYVFRIRKIDNKSGTIGPASLRPALQSALTHRDQIGEAPWRGLVKYVAALLMPLAIVIIATVPLPPNAIAADRSAQEWMQNRSYRIDFLGRDGPNGSDHYRVTLDWGATFFGVAFETMPLLPAEQAVNILIAGYNTTFPGRPTEDIQPGDCFDFYVPPGTLVCTKWRQSGANAVEYRSLLGDQLILYLDPFYPIKYRLARADANGRVEVMINHEADLKPNELAQSLFGQNDPSFKPDYLQIQRAKDIIDNRTDIVTVNDTRKHIDDFLEIRAGGEVGEKTEQGLQIYWFKPDNEAQQIFRVDDGIGDETDPSKFPSPSRVYYYKNGVVRTYQRVQDTTFISARQPNNEAWSKVFAEWGRLSPAPTRWEIGQPEQDSEAEELRRLGIAVLRFQPKQPPKGNFLTQFLDMLLAMMKRQQD